MPHPPYSPNIALSDFYFWFPLDEKAPQRLMFYQCGRGETKMAEALKGIKMNKFKNCFEQWKNRLYRCITSNGEYVEGD